MVVESWRPLKLEMCLVGDVGAIINWIGRVWSQWAVAGPSEHPGDGWCAKAAMRAKNLSVKHAIIKVYPSSA